MNSKWPLLIVDSSIKDYNILWLSHHPTKLGTITRKLEETERLWMVASMYHGLHASESLVAPQLPAEAEVLNSALLG